MEQSNSLSVDQEPVAFRDGDLSSVVGGFFGGVTVASGLFTLDIGSVENILNSDGGTLTVKS